jgi:hypothetical protein
MLGSNQLVIKLKWMAYDGFVDGFVDGFMCLFQLQSIQDKSMSQACQ